MRKRSFFTILIAMTVLCALLCVNLTSCVPSITANAEDLMEGIEPDPDVKAGPVSKDSAKKAADFAARLLKNCDEEGKNVLVSPVSVMAALAMTANGAEGETLSQMESTLGMTRQELNTFFKAYLSSLPQTVKNRLSIANSVWFKDEMLTVDTDFLQTNADYYGADAYKAPFDGQTLKDINNWVKDNTDGMIPEILDAIPANAIMYLVNALAFEAEWSSVYHKWEVSKGLFTLEDGTQRAVDLMYSDESTYIETPNATGFIKYYNSKQYAFAALLPNEGVKLSELVESLDGETICNALAGSKYMNIKAAIPKFETGYSAELSETLSKMGMPLAFDREKADFSGIGATVDGRVRIGRVLHKTFISVAEKGTKAGAATVVETLADGYVISERTIYLDRPFVYMLIDTENNIPFFIGTVEDVGK